MPEENSSSDTNVSSSSGSSDSPVPPPAASPPTSFTGYNPAVAAAPVTQPPPTPQRLRQPNAATSLPVLLRRLSYVLSVILGSSAVVAGVWSTFLLPLLHACYSARHALVTGQIDRWKQMADAVDNVKRLYTVVGGGGTRRIRATSLTQSDVDGSDQAHSVALPIQPAKITDADADADADTNGSSHTTTESDDNVSGSDRAQRGLHADTLPLSTALRGLASSLDATSTTRTSLLSTLEGYTSALHRDMFVARPPTWGGGAGRGSSAGGAVGLGTLGANLAQASGGGSADALGLGLGLGAGSAGGAATAARSEEWDAVRREIRAIKGMLLNRRNFAALPARTR